MISIYKHHVHTPAHTPACSGIIQVTNVLRWKLRNSLYNNDDNNNNNIFLFKLGEPLARGYY